jgi:hypothetical protein
LLDTDCFILIQRLRPGSFNYLFHGRVNVAFVVSPAVMPAGHIINANAEDLVQEYRMAEALTFPGNIVISFYPSPTVFRTSSCMRLITAAEIEKTVYVWPSGNDPVLEAAHPAPKPLILIDPRLNTSRIIFARFKSRIRRLLADWSRVLVLDEMHSRIRFLLWLSHGFSYFEGCTHSPIKQAGFKAFFLLPVMARCFLSYRSFPPTHTLSEQLLSRYASIRTCFGKLPDTWEMPVTKFGLEREEKGR